MRHSSPKRISTAISSDFYETYIHSVKITAKLHGYPTGLYEPGNNGLVIGDYGSIAKSLFDDGTISESHYFSLMRDIGVDIYNGRDNGDKD